MIDTVFGIKVRMSGLCINRYWPIIGRLLDADYRPADFRPLPYQCISSFKQFKTFWHLHFYLCNDVHSTVYYAIMQYLSICCHHKPVLWLNLR